MKCLSVFVSSSSVFGVENLRLILKGMMLLWIWLGGACIHKSQISFWEPITYIEWMNYHLIINHELWTFSTQEKQKRFDQASLSTNVIFYEYFPDFNCLWIHFQNSRIKLRVQFSSPCEAPAKWMCSIKVHHSASYKAARENDMHYYVPTVTWMLPNTILYTRALMLYRDTLKGLVLIISLGKNTNDTSWFVFFSSYALLLCVLCRK